MATTQEIKASKRAELDKLLVENGLDPAEYTTVDAAKEALYPFATDAEEQGDEGDEGEENAEDQGDAEETPNVPENEAEAAADKAEEPEVKPTNIVPTGHAEHFDEFGQPVFGNPKKAKK